MVKNKHNKKFYAVKKQKIDLKDKKQQQHVQNEAEVLGQLDFPFIVHLYVFAAFLLMSKISDV